MKVLYSLPKNFLGSCKKGAANIDNCTIILCIPSFLTSFLMINSNLRILNILNVLMFQLFFINHEEIKMTLCSVVNNLTFLFFSLLNSLNALLAI